MCSGVQRSRDEGSGSIVNCFPGNQHLQYVEGSVRERRPCGDNGIRPMLAAGPDRCICPICNRIHEHESNGQKLIYDT